MINTTPIVAMLVPASKELEQSRGAARELLLPITHVTTLAGSITLIGTSSNLLIAGIAGDNNVTMTMLSFAPVALPVALVGALVIYLTAPHLPSGGSEHRQGVVRLPRPSAPGRQSYQPETVGPAFVGVIRIRQRPCLIMAAR